MQKYIARWSWLAPALTVAASPAFSQGLGHAHVHGIASLQVTVDGPTLTLRLRTPLENLVGFEHAPSTDAQKQALRDMHERLREAESHFAPTAGARCATASMKIDAPFPTAGEPQHETSGAGRDKAEPSGGKAAHKHGREAEAHAELTAQYVFRCEAPVLLRGLEVKLFDSFRRLRRVDMEVAAPHIQKSYRLTSKSRVAKW